MPFKSLRPAKPSQSKSHSDILSAVLWWLGQGFFVHICPKRKACIRFSFFLIPILVINDWTLFSSFLASRLRVFLSRPKITIYGADQKNGITYWFGILLFWRSFKAASTKESELYSPKPRWNKGHIVDKWMVPSFFSVSLHQRQVRAHSDNFWNSPPWYQKF